MANKICSDCGTEQDETFKYCKNCGALLSTEKNQFIPTNEEYEFEDKTKNNSNDVKVCPECGEKQELFAKFCRNCGASLSSENKDENVMICEYCGAELNNEAFCPDCGKPTGIKICPNCRQKTVNEDYCTVCGYKINPNVKTCANCGSKMDAQAKVCANCGAGVIHKSPFVALVLSFIFPGLGQLYNKQTRKCITLILVYILSWILSLIIIGAILAFLIWIYGMYDAFTTSKALNRGELVEDKLF